LQQIENESPVSQKKPEIPILPIAKESPREVLKEETKTPLKEEPKEPIWLSLSNKSSPKKEEKKPKGNILTQALKHTDPEKIPVWFRELETKESSRKVADLDLPEKHEEPQKESPTKEDPSPRPIRSSRSRNGSDSARLAPLVIDRSLVPEKSSALEAAREKRKPSRSKSRPKRPQVLYNSSVGIPDASASSSISNETFDSLMKFKFSHLGRLKPRDAEENVKTEEPTEIQPPVWRIDKKKSSVKVTEQVKTQNQPFSIPRLDSPEDEIVEEEGDDFVIPIYPSGSKLTINIKEGWGDPHYLGLSGIEMFDKNGNLISLNDVLSQVKANPSDVNSLPGYSNDPRTVDKLFDGVNMTCDDLHQWLTPYTPGGDHFIYVNLNEKVTFSMIRFWNYNKSRIHSYRGARFLEMYLDDKLIFKGEIKKASGTLSSVESCCECILFTTEMEVLERIEKYDQEVYGSFLTSTFPEPASEPNATERPNTASKDAEETENSFNPIEHFSNLNPLERPMTSATPKLSFIPPKPRSDYGGSRIYSTLD